MDFLISLWRIVNTNPVIIGVWWFIIVIISGILITRALAVVQKILITFYNTASTSPQWHITIVQALVWIANVATWIVIVTLVASRMGMPPSLITAVGTIIGAALGFGSQEIVRDVVKGGVHLLEKQFSVGDYVGFTIGGVDHAGVVSDVTLRTVVVATEEQGVVSVPQGNISLIKNYSRSIGEFLINLPFDTSVSVSPIIDIITSVTDEVGEDNNRTLSAFLSREELEVVNRIISLTVRGVSAVDKGYITIQVKGEAPPGEQFSAKRALLKAIAGQLEASGITFYSAKFPTGGG